MQFELRYQKVDAIWSTCKHSYYTVEESSILIDTDLTRPIVAINEITVRKASLADSTQISALVNLGVAEGQLLPRSK
jgi:hypothetical protein